MKKKTSIVVDTKLWKEFLMLTIRKHGSTRKISEELENALQEYLNRHRGEHR